MVLVNNSVVAEKPGRSKEAGDALPGRLRQVDEDVPAAERLFHAHRPGRELVALGAMATAAPFLH